MVGSNYWQAVRPYGKTKRIVTAFVSGGWLRLMVQGIFGFIIVCSFILIMLMTFDYNYRRDPHVRCRIRGCRIVCSSAPYFEKFERDVIDATTDTEACCNAIILQLNNPMFVNSCLPVHWLSGIRVDVSQLEIVGGNLRHIPPDSFQSQFAGNIKVLVLEKVIITTLAPDTFIGLSSIEELHINDCGIMNIRHNALKPIAYSLKTLRIRSDNLWNPVNITGSSEFLVLRVVDFSMNNFSNILGYNSFTGLRYCKVLFLNSCKITSIGVGTFDSLKSIEILHLNNNYLISLPPNIFDMIIPLDPRISLHENLWNCTCYSNLRLLLKLDLLIVEPKCYYPNGFRGEKISSFEKYCDEDPVPKLIDNDLYIFGSKAVSQIIDYQCSVNASQENSSVLRSPLPHYKCLSNKILQPFKNPPPIGLFSKENNWLRPSYSIDSRGCSMVSLVFSDPHDYGLIWYRSSCPKEIYCINHIPKLLRVYNEDSGTEYTFCRISETSKGIHRDQCVACNLASLQTSNIFLYKSILLTVCIAIICLLSGALCVYAMIHKNPNLLKGNKRVVFVKHKTVDALILPAKTSVISNLPKESNKSVGLSSDIFVIPRNRLDPSEKLSRTNSVRTNESNDPSYISALQPTEDQLAEWRITRNFEATYTQYNSIDSDLTIHSRMPSTSCFPYFSHDKAENIYDTIKL